MIVRGTRAPVVGAVSMDLTTIDITDIAGASVGDEVILWGESGGEGYQRERRRAPRANNFV